MKDAKGQLSSALEIKLDALAVSRKLPEASDLALRHKLAPIETLARNDVSSWSRTLC